MKDSIPVALLDNSKSIEKYYPFDTAKANGQLTVSRQVLEDKRQQSIYLKTCPSEGTSTSRGLLLDAACIMGHD